MGIFFGFSKKEALSLADLITGVIKDIIKALEAGEAPEERIAPYKKALEDARGFVYTKENRTKRQKENDRDILCALIELELFAGKKLFEKLYDLEEYIPALMELRKKGDWDITNEFYPIFTSCISYLIEIAPVEDKIAEVEKQIGEIEADFDTKENFIMAAKVSELKTLLVDLEEKLESFRGKYAENKDALDAILNKIKD